MGILGKVLTAVICGTIFALVREALRNAADKDEEAQRRDLDELQRRTWTDGSDWPTQ